MKINLRGRERVSITEIHVVKETKAAKIKCSNRPVLERLASTLSNCYGLLCEKGGNETGRPDRTNKLHSLQRNYTLA